MTKKIPDQIKKAKKIITSTEQSVKNFFDAFDELRGSRANAPTDVEQDILRAALVFSAAGLDSVIKRLIKDCLTTIINSNENAKKEFQKYIERRLDGKKIDISSGYKFLSEILVSNKPNELLIEQYKKHLTGESLQSVKQIEMVIKALGLEQEKHDGQIILEENLKEIFQTRNKIIHELDVNFKGGHGQRKRNSRTKADLVNHSNILIALAKSITLTLEKKL